MGQNIYFYSSNRKSHEIQINSREKKKDDNEIFEDMEEIKEDIYVGIGIKRMKGYKCSLRIDELNKKREHFWDVKTDNKNQNWLIWSTIKRAVSKDEERASILLDEYNIKTVNGCLNHLIDSDGNEYKIPNYCINDPYFGIINSGEKDVKEEKLILNFYGAKKLKLEVSNKLKGKELKNDIRIKEKIEDNKKMRLFYRGIEIKDDDFLFNHNINENTLINILLI
jgi:hypothetical protein